MATPFSSTLRSLEADRPGWTRYLAWASAVLFVVGVLWSTLARVPLHVRAVDARVEAEGRSYQIQAASHAGSVVHSHLELGSYVEAGQVLLEIEPHLEVHQLEAERTRLQSLVGEVVSTRAQIERQQEALRHDQRSRNLGISESDGLLKEAEAHYATTTSELTRSRRLFESGLASSRELEIAENAARADSAVVVSLRATVDRQATEAERSRADRLAEVSRLEAKLSHLEGEAQISETAIHAFEHELEHFAISTPASGRLAQVAELKRGSYLQAGAWIATVVPDGPVQLVAHLDAAATGRVAVGQRSRFWLDAFPWTEYGSVLATVRRVAQDTFSGQILAEFSISERSAHEIQLRHGMTGTIEIEVEQVSPAQLVLRELGRRFRGVGEGRASSGPFADSPAELTERDNAGETGSPLGMGSGLDSPLGDETFGGFTRSSTVRTEEEDEEEEER